MAISTIAFGMSPAGSPPAASVHDPVRHAAWQSSGSIVFVPWYVAHMARAHAELGRFDEAQRHMAEALASIEKTGERWCESDVRRIAGEIALLAPERDINRAETHFERALAVAREQQAKSWELRAAMSLARLWRDRGERARARGLLGDVYGWFREGFETFDLKQARMLLDELGC